MNKDRIKNYLTKLKSLETDASERDNWINRISNYALPTLYNYKYDVTNTRSNLPSDVYDSEMVQASVEFANLFFSYLTNPANKWFTFTISNKKIREIAGVKDYLEELVQESSSLLLNTNFYSSIQQAFYTLVTGNCILYREQDDYDTIRYYALPPSECYYEFNSQNRITSMYRKLKKSPLQLVESFPDTVHENVKKNLKNNVHTLINICHIVRPRWQRDPEKKDKLNKKFESITLDIDNESFLKEDGYDKFPFFIGHYLRDHHSPYSYGPAHLCFYDSKSLNQLVLSQLRRAAKEADPTVSLPHDGYILPFLQDPGSVNYRTSDDPKDSAQFIMPPPASSAVNDNIVTFRQKIKRAFFVDLFRSIVDSTKRMTAFEVQQVLADRAPMLGPAVWNLTTDFLNHIINDLIEILIEKGTVPAPPLALQGKQYTIEYLSPLAKAQKMGEFNSMVTFLQFLGSTAQFNQDVIDNIDWDDWTRNGADITGVPQSSIQEKGDVATNRKKRYEALARAQQKQELLQASSALKDATQADKNLTESGAVTSGQ